MTLELDDARPPTPPADLMSRVAPSFQADQMEASRRAFDVDGLEHLKSFERALAGTGHSFSDFHRLLDFGCGCGRFIRHLRPVSDQVEVHGTDIDAEMIEWLNQNVAYGRFTVGPHEPPLPYPDRHFDLILNHSVFTHLDERHQDLWLGELQRITAPGALLLLTVEGQSSWNLTCEASEQAGDNVERWRTELETRGILVITDDHWIGSTHPDFYHSTIHAPWYVFEHWTRYFELVSYTIDGSWLQDLIVLRRRPDGQPRARPIGHRSAGDSSPELAGPPAADAGRAQPTAKAAGLDPEGVRREINMLRAGLYEQGGRISVLAAQLREEIEAVRPPPPPAPPPRRRRTGLRLLKGRVVRAYRDRSGALGKRRGNPR